MSKLVQDLAKAMRTASGSKTKPADDTAVVRRIEGGTAWVHIPGGVDETPVEMTIDCKPGEAVKVRRAGGKAWLVGNGSAPPTDNTRANQVGERLEQKLEQNTQVITGDVRRVYKDVGSLSRNVDALGDDVETLDTLIRESSAGVEVGKVNSAGEYVAGHTLIDADDASYKIIDANGNVVASFGATSRIGRDGRVHVELSSTQFSVIPANSRYAQIDIKANGYYGGVYGSVGNPSGGSGTFSFGLSPFSLHIEENDEGQGGSVNISSRITEMEYTDPDAGISQYISLDSESGEISTTGSYRVNNDALIKTRTISEDSVSVPAAASGAYTQKQITFSNADYDGYTPIGVINWAVGNASSGGAGASYISTYQVFLQNSTTVNFYIRNHSAAQANVKLTATVLYVSNGII